MSVLRNTGERVRFKKCLCVRDRETEIGRMRKEKKVRERESQERERAPVIQRERWGKRRNLVRESQLTDSRFSPVW